MVQEKPWTTMKPNCVEDAIRHARRQSCRRKLRPYLMPRRRWIIFVADEYLQYTTTSTISCPGVVTHTGCVQM
ncbi:hypothetical protein VN97_g149 [Penicillium thymicola]|uniref:Uncharacterized protein n=1 Tax=Penicillium thymicola TaxID=293382 RepID=A0AAI9TUL4_PENTH|nr:hypothetical protein VN97_g149 [Penicillium thymicola]